MNRIDKFSTSSFFSSFFLIIFLCIGFIPNLNAVDKIAPQWLFMSVLNFISTLYVIYNRKIFFKTTDKIVSSYILITYSLFIVWSALSYFYAINQTEVIVNITRQINVFLMTFFMCVFLSQLKHKATFITIVIGIILSIEVYYVLIQTMERLDSAGNLIERASIKGVAANPNITAFSIANKLPFLFYIIIFFKNRILKIFISLLLFLSLVCLTIIQSRASYLATLFILILSLFSLIYLYVKDKKKSFLYSFCLIFSCILLAIISNQIFFSNKGADAIKRIGTISISNSDKSISARLRYYSHVLEQIKASPIFGVGLGNWKLKSIKYDAKDIKGYVVPYHAHSDFIQLGAEVGIFGILLYLGIFLWTIYYILRIILFSNIIDKEKLFLFFVLLSLGSYTIDANLNFPIARPQVLVVWSLIIAIGLSYYNETHKLNDIKSSFKSKISYVFLFLNFIFLIPTIYVTNKVYKSLKGQMLLLQDFNTNQYNIPLNKVEDITPDIPNITVTTIPMNSVKARYFVKAKKYEKAKKLLEKGTKANPHLFYSEILKSQIFQETGLLDSAKLYAKRAFFGLPNNDLHSSRYINLINITNDKSALEEAFELLTYNDKLINWKNYLAIASRLYSPGDKKIVKRAEKAVKLFPNETTLKNLYNQISIGIDEFNLSIEYSKKGLEYFNIKDYKNASIEFEKAIDLNPLDYSHYENAATSNYMTGNLEKALIQINKVINDLNPLNGKCEYIKALIFIKIGDNIGACPLLEKSRDSGFNQALPIISQYCS